MGRPLGEKSRAVLAAVMERPRPLREIALELKLSHSDAQNALATLKRNALVVYGDKVPGAHDRPARVLRPAPESPPQIIRLFP